MTWSTNITTAFNNQSFIVREVVGRNVFMWRAGACFY